MEANVVAALSNILKNVGRHEWRALGGVSSSASFGSGNWVLIVFPGLEFPLRPRRDWTLGLARLTGYFLVTGRRSGWRMPVLQIGRAERYIITRTRALWSPSLRSKEILRRMKDLYHSKSIIVDVP